MNLEFDVDFKGTEVRIKGSTINRVEFSFVVLVHQARHEQFDVLSFSICYGDCAIAGRSGRGL